MNKCKIFLILLLSQVAMITYAQEEYKVSDKNPFGKVNPKAPQQVSDYADLIGVCDCISIRRNAANELKDTTEMVWQFKYIFNGMAVQDESWKSDGAYNSSIRQFNTDSLQWYVTFFSASPVNASPSTWSGGKNEEGNMVLYLSKKAPNGMEGFSRLTFFDITEKGFNWIGEWVSVNGQFVYPFWKIFCKKRVDKHK